MPNRLRKRLARPWAPTIPHNSAARGLASSLSAFVSQLWRRGRVWVASAAAVFGGWLRWCSPLPMHRRQWRPAPPSSRYAPHDTQKFPLHCRCPAQPYAPPLPSGFVGVGHWPPAHRRCAGRPSRPAAPSSTSATNDTRIFHFSAGSVLPSLTVSSRSVRFDELRIERWCTSSTIVC